MMLCDDISSNLPPARGQSKCSTEGLQLDLKDGEILECSVSEQMALSFESNGCLKSIPTSNDQGNWQASHPPEQRTRDVELGNQCVYTEMQNTDSKIMENVMSSSEMLPESRCSKRVADYTDLQHTSCSMTKRIRLDEHLVQEHWKKGALGQRLREMPMGTSDCGDREVAKCSKELSLRVNRLDSTILHNEMALSKLRSTRENLKDSVTSSNKDSGELESEVGGGGKEELKPQPSCLEQVLVENRRKADASHAFLDKMKSVTGLLLYQQPRATAVYHENKQKFVTFKKRLVAYLKNKDEAQQIRSVKLNEQQSRFYDAWKQKMETVESGRKPKSKKLRDYFEKIFPEMQKQEEEKMQRYYLSALKLNQTSEQKCNVNETFDKMNVEVEVVGNLKSLAALPSSLLDSRNRRLRFLNENGFIEDPEQINDTSALKCSFWTDHEREIFTEKYIQNPKKFGLIASFLENKSVQDCVQFYYLTKKEFGYKKLQRPKYSRKLKIRASANNLKEERAESKNLAVEPQCEQSLPSGSESNIACEQKNVSEVKLSDEPALLPVVESSVLEPVSSPPDQLVSSLPSNSAESSSPAGTVQSSRQLKVTDASAKGSEQEIPVSDLGCGPDAQPTEVEERIELQNSGKAAAGGDDDDDDDDNESVATLSADEAAGHCPDDDNNQAEKTPSMPLQTAEKGQNTSGTEMQAAISELFRAEVNCVQNSQRLLSASVNLEESQRFDQEERKQRSATPAASPLLALNSRNEFHRLVRSSPKDVDERVKVTPELVPLTATIPQGRSQEAAYSPTVGARSRDGLRVALQMAGPYPFPRNSGSPTRIRDLIHAAIEKNLQAIDGKPDLVSSLRNDSEQFRSSNSLNYKPPSASASAVENTEVQDLSMRSARCASTASRITAPAAGRPLPHPPTLYQFPKVDSPYHPRPAHTHHPDARAGSLLDLANAAEYEHLRRLEREHQKTTAERDSSFKRFEASLTGESYGLNPTAQTWRQRGEPVHKGSIMQGTPVSTAHHYRIQNARQAGGACIEGLGIHPSTVGHNTGIQPDPASWQRSSYLQVVPQISSEHNKLLRNDFLTAQQLRTMQESSLRGDVREHLQQYHPYQDVPPPASIASQYDTRAADVLYQPSRAAPEVQNVSNTDSTSYHRRQLPVRQFQDEKTVAGGQMPLRGSWMSDSRQVVPDFRNGPSEAYREMFSTGVQADRNPAARVKSVPVLPCKPNPLGWQKISAAQLIEEIINNQISKPDVQDKIQSSSILRQIDEISPALYGDSAFVHAPITLRSNRNGNEQMTPMTISRSVVPEKTPEFFGRRSEEGSIPNIGTRERHFVSDRRIHRGDMDLPVSERVCFSGTVVAPDRSLNLSSGRLRNDKAFPFNVTNVDSEDKSFCSRQVKRPATIGESLDAVVEEATRRGNHQNPIDSNQFAMRNFVAGSDSIHQTNSHQREDFGSETGLDQSNSSSPRPAALAKANRFNSDELIKSKESQEGGSNDRSSFSRLFNWKTKLLREHQKQQVESEDTGQTVQKSTELERRAYDRQSHQLPSSEKLSLLNDQEGSSAFQSDTANYPASRMPSPSDAHCSFGSSTVYTVGEDCHSTIAATHQMMSTLLSNRSGRQPGQLVPPSSLAAAAAAGPIQPDPPPSKPTTSKELAQNEAVVPEQGEKQADSPVATGPESPSSDSRGSDQPGRLVIRMDSAED